MIHRIRERAAFDRLGREGARIRSASLWCTFLSDPTASPPKVAFAIGRAVGPAVTRNRLRRRLRTLLVEAARADRLPPGWYLIGARPTAIELTFDELRVELTNMLRRTQVAT